MAMKSTYPPRGSRPGFEGGRHGEDDFALPTKEELIEILDGGAPQKLVQWAERIAEKRLAAGKDRDKLATSQIRNIYGTVKKLEIEGKNQETIYKLVLLKPKLAYAAGRNDSIGMKTLQQVLRPFPYKNIPAMMLAFQNISGNIR